MAPTSSHGHPVAILVKYGNFGFFQNIGPH